MVSYRKFLLVFEIFSDSLFHHVGSRLLILFNKISLSLFQAFILPYFYHKKSAEEEKLEAIETTVKELKENVTESGNLKIMFSLSVMTKNTSQNKKWMQKNSFTTSRPKT